MTPPPSLAFTTASSKLTQRELAAVRAELRRELRAELADELAAKKARRKATRGEVELPEQAAAAKRMIHSLGKRAAVDVEGLAELHALHAVVDAELAAAIAAARRGDGLNHGVRYSWADVGRVLGMTRQAAQQRFGR